MTEPAAKAAFKVRSGRRGDAQGITALMAELGMSCDAQTVTWIVSHPEMELLVGADALDKVVGVLALSHRPQIHLAGRVMTIDELAVAKAWRKQGVGRELLKRAVDRAKVLGVKRVEIQTLGVDDDGAKTFLGKCGFDAAGASVWRLK
ncbi:MAG: GNAT family N-acetyltransferase [Myxococcaceae bacterium]